MLLSLAKVANPSSQDRTPRGAIVLAVSPAAANYRASGLVLWRKAAARQSSDVCLVRHSAGPLDEPNHSINSRDWCELEFNAESLGGLWIAGVARYG